MHAHPVSSHIYLNSFNNNIPVYEYFALYLPYCVLCTVDDISMHIYAQKYSEEGIKSEYFIIQLSCTKQRIDSFQLE